MEKKKTVIEADTMDRWVAAGIFAVVAVVFTAAYVGVLVTSKAIELIKCDVHA